VGTVRDHYDSFLGPVYSWILGDFDSAYRKNVELFASLKLTPGPGAIAVDLGCGPGCQSLPLAELGYDVLALDFCQELLDELAGRSRDLNINAVCADILDFGRYLPRPPELIVCMGDTLVHLPDGAAVEALIDDIAKALMPGGVFIYAIRDYVDQVPEGADRFIPIRANDEQIFTCFLDYKDDVVHVHDVLYRKVDGDWMMRVSDYLKLRLDTAKINKQVEGLGLVCTDRLNLDGLITVVIRKPE